MSREALVLLVCCCDFRDGAERLISSKSLRNAVIRAFPGLFRILRMCAPRRAAAVVRPREREKSADRRRRILISRLLIIRASVPRRKSPFPAYFKGFPAVSLLIPPYPAFLKYPVSPHALLIVFELFCNFVFAVSAAELVVYAAFSIGYSFNKRKELWTVILILVFFQLAQFTAIAMIGLFIHTWISLDANTLPTGIELLLLWGMLGELLFCAIGYAVTWYFTTKKLNLE